jgi:hypothetical protein
MKYGRLLLFAFCFLNISRLVGAQSAPSQDAFLGSTFLDNTDVRKQYWTGLITAPKEQVWSFTERTVGSKAGQVKVKSVKRGADFLVQFINSPGGVFSEYSQGSYVVQRDSKTGYILQSKIFLADDPGCYARLYPQGEGTRLDVIMYGAVVKRGLSVSGLIYYVLAEPFSELVAETRRSFDWSTVFGPGSVSKAQSLASDLRTSQAAQAAQDPSQTQGPQVTQPSLPPQPAAQAQAAAPQVSMAQAPRIGIVGQPAISVSPQTPPVAAPSRAASSPSLALVSLVGKTAGADALMACLTSRGQTCSELGAVPAVGASASGGTQTTAPAQALGLSDDSDPLVPALPYRTFPRYDATKGLSLAALRGTLYLDALSCRDAAYLLVGDSLRVIVTPYFDGSGSFHFAFFVDGKETSWQDIATGKDRSVRVIRLTLGS